MCHCKSKLGLSTDSHLLTDGFAFVLGLAGGQVGGSGGSAHGRPPWAQSLALHLSSSYFSETLVAAEVKGKVPLVRLSVFCLSLKAQVRFCLLPTAFLELSTQSSRLLGVP